MECHRSGRQRPLGCQGQSTLEYALVTVAALAIAVAFGTFLKMLDSGAFAMGVLDALARRLPTGVLDILTV